MKKQSTWGRLLLGLCLAGLLGGCIHQESYDKIVARNGRPTELRQGDGHITAIWGEGEDRNWVIIDTQTQRLVNSSENNKFRCKYLNWCEFTRSEEKRQ